jgi:hypothetical protein
VESLAYTRDLATDGCFLHTHEPARVGEKVVLAFHLPIPGGRDVRAEGEVVRVQPGGIAVHFKAIAAADRVELGRYLRSRRKGVIA